MKVEVSSFLWFLQVLEQWLAAVPGKRKQLHSYLIQIA
jgi:hypothetical protein